MQGARNPEIWRDNDSFIIKTTKRRLKKVVSHLDFHTIECSTKIECLLHKFQEL